MSRARALLEAEVATSTLVLHLKDRSTDFLTPIYDGHGYHVVSDRIQPKELMALIKSHSRIYGLGHGSPSGLFAAGFMIDDRFGPLLAEKQDGLYIWCNADAYAVRNKLSGLVSGMFISEVLEARMFGIEASQQEVDASNNMFSKLVRQMLDTGAPPESVRQCYSQSNAACRITQFNSERLYIFKNGTPSPALHPTSLGNPREQYLPREPKQDAPEEEQLGFIEWQPWIERLDALAKPVGITLNDLSEWERDMVEDAFMDGATPEDVIQHLTSDSGGNRPF